MSEIQTGNTFSVSTRLMQEVHKAATNDNTVDASELARLVQIASEDASGLTEDEKILLLSLFTKKLDTSGLSPAEKALFEKLGESSTSQEIVDQNIQALKNLASHDSEANVLDFSKLQLVSETKSLLSKVTFGLFGGTNKARHNIVLSDGNIPVISNPPTTTTAMSERREMERNNLIRMMGPLKQELQEGLNPNSDVRQRLSKRLGLPPDGPEMTEKIEALLKKIEDFEKDPNKADWTSSSDLTELMNSYAKNPPVGNPRINSAYMNLLLGAYWNAWDSTLMQNKQRNQFQEGNIQSPATLEALNQKLQTANQTAQTDVRAVLDKASDLITQLDALKASDPALYKQLIRGTDESAIDLLRAQVSDLKHDMSTAGSLGQAQFAQLNHLYANLHQLEKTFAADSSSDEKIEADIAALQAMLADPNLPESQKAEFQKEIDKLQSQLITASSANSEKLEAIRNTLAAAKDALSTATSSTQDAALTRSSMVFELEQAESTLVHLLSQYGISEAGRSQLQAQLDATRAALTQLKNNQEEVKFENPDQQAAFEKVLQNLQQLRPIKTSMEFSSGARPSESSSSASESPATSPTEDKTSSEFSIGLNNPLLRGFGSSLSSSGTLRLGGPSLNFSPSLTLETPEPPLGFSTDSETTFGLPVSGFSLGGNLGGMCSYSSLSNSYLGDPFGYSADPFGLFPSLGYGGGFAGVGGYDPFFSGYDPFFPSLGLSLGTPVTDSSSVNTPTQPSQPPTSPRPSLSNLFLEGVGENPANLRPLSPEMEQRQKDALDMIAQLEKLQTVLPEVKGIIKDIKTFIENPTLSTDSFNASLNILENYREILNKGVPSEKAQVLFLMGAKSIQGRGSSEIEKIKHEIEQIKQKDPQTIAKSLDSFYEKLTLERTKNLANNVLNSGIYTQILSIINNDPNLKAKIIQDVRDISGKNINTIEEALDFLKKEKTDLKPSLLVQIISSPAYEKYAHEFEKMKINSQDLEKEEQRLLKEVQQFTGNLTIRNLREAIPLLEKSGNTQLVAEINKFLSSKAQQASLQHLLKYAESFKNTEKILTDTLKRLESIEPRTPQIQAEINLINSILKKFRETGFITPEEYALFARSRVNRNMRFMETTLLRIPTLTDENREKLQDLFNKFFSAGNAEQQREAFQAIIRYLRSGAIYLPLDLNFQRDMFQALELPTVNQALSSDEFLNAISRFDPFEMTRETAIQGAQLMSANDIANQTIRDEQTPPEDTSEQAVAFVRTVTEADTSNQAVAQRAAKEPENEVYQAANTVNQTREERRLSVYSLPPDQQREELEKDYQEFKQVAPIFHQMHQALSEILNQLGKANDQYMIAHGYPPLSEKLDLLALEKGEFADPELSEETEALIAEANALADRLILAPTPTVSGDQYLSDLLNNFLSIIRDLDFKTRALIMQQLTQRMVNNAITQFYKDKSDENNKYHQEALSRLQANFKNQITHMLRTHLVAQAASSQSIAAVSGEVRGADLSRAMQNVRSASEMVKDLFAVTDQMSPPLSNFQKMRILNQLDRVMAAAGTSDLRDDQTAITGLRRQLSMNR